MSRALTTLWIGLGGALGTIARYWIAIWALPLSRSLPWGTIGINISGSFIIGFVGTLTLMQGRYPLPETGRLFVMVGLCGGFTTFSAFSLQTLDLIRNGAWARALINIVASVVLCLLAVAAGHAFASLLNGGARQIAQTAVEEEAG
jgi:fluoride exporter